MKMRYRLTLSIISDETIHETDTFIELMFPYETHFVNNVIISNALSQLIPVLVGKALNDMEEKESENEG